MPIAIIEDQGVARVELSDTLGPDEAREARLVGAGTEQRVRLAGLEAPVSPALADRLLAAGAQDHRE